MKIVCLLARNSEKPIRTYVLEIPNQEDDEIFCLWCTLFALCSWNLNMGDAQEVIAN